MKRIEWDHSREMDGQLGRLRTEAESIGYFILAYPAGGTGDRLPWSTIERWIRSRAVTVADISGELGSPALLPRCCHRTG